jgi:hypothetical protein
MNNNKNKPFVVKWGHTYRQDPGQYLNQNQIDRN